MIRSFKRTDDGSRICDPGETVIVPFTRKTEGRVVGRVQLRLSGKVKYLGLTPDRKFFRLFIIQPGLARASTVIRR